MAGKKKHILIVEDEQDLCEVIETILIQKDVDVTTANDGAQAVELLQNNDFDLVLSDFKMPKMTGIQVFEWTKEHKPTPFVLMTGYSDISSAEDAKSIGLSGFLPKPFNFDSLNELVDNLMADKYVTAEPARKDISTNETEEKTLGEYLKIPIGHFFCDHQISYSIYLDVKGSYKKIAHKGDDLDKDRIQKYQDKGVEYFYLTKEDFINYVNLQLSMTRSHVSITGSSPRKNIKLVSNILQDIYSKAYIDGIDQDLYESSVKTIELALTSACNSEDVCFLMNDLKSKTPDLYTHSLQVCLVSVATAKKLGYHSEEDLSDIAIGSFFHDIGESFAELDLKKLSPEQLEAAKKNILGTHPERGHQMLSSIKGISQRVLAIVAHHEDMFGTLNTPGKDGLASLHHIVCVVNKVCYVDNPSLLESIDHVLKNEEYASRDVLFSLKEIFSNANTKNAS